jgi:signal transduction histidine kinase/ActR/RegA family two-component response regulator
VNRPIRGKLLRIILLTSGSVLLLTCSILFAYQYYTFRQAAVHNLATLGEVIAANSTAALAFENVDDAATILAALDAEPQVVAAGLYKKDGTLFATYPANIAGTELPTATEADGYRFDASYLVGFQSVAERDNKRLGTLYLRSDMRPMYANFWLYGLVVAAVIALALFAAYLISLRLQQQISEPILALANTALAVSERSDYSVRAAPAAGLELGQLTGAFNHMLTRIQTQLGNLALLQQITRAIAERQDMNSIFKVVLRNLEDSMPIDFGAICLYDPIRQTLTVRCIGERSALLSASVGLSDLQVLPADRNGLARCVLGVLVYEPDIRDATSAFPQQLARGGLRSMVCAPLLVESTVFGVLIAARKTAKSFSSSDCEFLKQLSEHVALAAHQTELHGALQQAYDDLRQTQQTAMQQERLRALGQMASGIAHDINNAISPVALYTDALIEHEPLSERARGYLITIRQAIEDVADTVARMREFYRHREPQLVLAQVELNRLVKQVVELTRARWNAQPQERGIFIDLRAELDERLPEIMGAEGEIRDALTNLIFNAVDAMPEGGVLTVRSRALDRGDSTSNVRCVAIEVADTGVGMDGETRQRCLEPFYTTKGERGTGLGLAMVYGMVQRHSAELEIDSERGKGTTMRLIFPAATPALGTVTQFPASHVLRRRLCILIVDDDPLLIKSLRDILETDGHTVKAADGGQAGISAFFAADKLNPFDIVITDLGMPQVDGYKVAASIKSGSPRTPVIMLTGWGQRLLAEKSLPDHVDKVLAKPPRIQELRTALAEMTSAA